MRKQGRVRLQKYRALAACLLGIPAIAVAQAPAPSAVVPAPPPPQMPPSLVPSKVVDLMTPEGSAVFGAKWKTMEAKIVEGPALAIAAYRSSVETVCREGRTGICLTVNPARPPLFPR